MRVAAIYTLIYGTHSHATYSTLYKMAKFHETIFYYSSTNHRIGEIYIPQKFRVYGLIQLYC